ncbi:MAG: N-acetyltransferase family protein [Actinobacteria bacterium]|nr:N-acetyltransferase family protein [Actinomycetota bacterium]NCX64017.1 N-acetyltransferase family protein [Actinomycetota bacterium]
MEPLVVDSETRWRLVRKLRQNPEEPQTPVVIRDALEQDMPQVRDIYNFFIQNTVITFDDKPLDLGYWQDIHQLLTKNSLPFIVLARGEQVLGFAYVAPWRQKTSYLKIVENSIYLAAAATGKKLGSRLFAELIERCRQSGIKEIIAVIADRGANASIALHKKHGFLEQGHLADVAVRFGRPIGSYLYSLKL